MIAPALARAVLAAARERGWRIATAESCTGGMVAAALTDIAGASDVVERGFVTYSNAAKTEVLGVSPDDIARFGAISEAVARAMATGALAHADAQLAIATTGIAGPGGSEHKPEGRVCFALAHPGGVWAETVEFGARGRVAVRLAATRHALAMLLAVLQPG